MPEKLLMEHVMLLAILSSHIGTEVGKFVFISFIGRVLYQPIGQKYTSNILI